jgi:hypothetical protein
VQLAEQHDGSFQFTAGSPTREGPPLEEDTRELLTWIAKRMET